MKLFYRYFGSVYTINKLYMTRGNTLRGQRNNICSILMDRSCSGNTKLVLVYFVILSVLLFFSSSIKVDFFRTKFK